MVTCSYREKLFWNETKKTTTHNNMGKSQNNAKKIIQTQKGTCVTNLFSKSVKINYDDLSQNGSYL